MVRAIRLGVEIQDWWLRDRKRGLMLVARVWRRAKGRLERGAVGAGSAKDHQTDQADVTFRASASRCSRADGS